VLVALVVAASLVAAGVTQSPPSIVLFAAASFVVASITQELWRATAIRRALTKQGPLAAVLGVIRLNRRRYGGYLVHIGMAVIFVGLAASSAFQHINETQLTPGHSSRIDGYDVRYVRPTAAVSAQKVSLGAVAESAVGLQAGVRRDIWTSVDPNISSLQPIITGLDNRFPRAGGQTQTVLLSLVAARYRAKPPAATFRFIVSPLVEWIWIGGLIAGAGGLLALVPSLSPRRRRVKATSPRRAGIGAQPIGEPVGETVSSR
jgi:cytochrome c-type biogenesis protein CcmF